MNHKKSAINVVSMFTITALITALAGCAGLTPTDGVGAGDYNPAQSRSAQDVQLGTIKSIRHVQISGSTQASSMVGTGVGAVLGGALGSLVGGGRGNTLATVLGVVGGGVAGNTIEKHVNTEMGDEITVSMDSGRVIAITQKAAPAGVFRRGDRVQVLSDDRGVSRIAPE